MVRRAGGYLDRSPGHDLRLSRLQPRGGDADPIVSRYTYTLESIIQSGKQLIALDHVACEPTR